MFRWRASILSLGSGDRIPVLVGQNEVCQKWQNLYSTIRTTCCDKERRLLTVVNYTCKFRLILIEKRKVIRQCTFLLVLKR